MKLAWLGLFVSISGLIFGAGMAYQALVSTQARQQEDIENIKHVLTSEHPSYTWNLYDK